MINKNKELTRYARSLAILLKKVDYSAVTKIINCFIRARESRAAIYFIGNGGSAATASHFAQDLAEIGRKLGKKGFKAQSLTDRTPFMTAIANDYGYENVFSEQLLGFINKGDYLVAISASGNSLNIIKAVKYAKSIGAETIGLVGFDGGKLKEICDVIFHVKTKKGEYGLVEDMHLILDHMIANYFYKSL